MCKYEKTEWHICYKWSGKNERDKNGWILYCIPMKERKGLRYKINSKWNGLRYKIASKENGLRYKIASKENGLRYNINSKKIMSREEWKSQKGKIRKNRI